MSGRRSHVRFAILQSPRGTVRVLQDVVIQNTHHDHTIALSREPGVLGELVSVQFPYGDDMNVWAKVLNSQPVVVDGSVRHQLQLHHLEESASDDDMARGIVSQ